MESDFFIELLEADWEKRKQRIRDTGEIETNDLLVNATLTLVNTNQPINGELGDIHGELRKTATKEQMAEIREQMVTKNSLYAGITIIGVIFAGLQFLMRFLI